MVKRQQAKPKTNLEKIAKQKAKLDEDSTELIKAKNKLAQFYQEINNKPLFSYPLLGILNEKISL